MSLVATYFFRAAHPAWPQWRQSRHPDPFVIFATVGIAERPEMPKMAAT
jgi:hypothetical protein